MIARVITLYSDWVVGAIVVGLSGVLVADYFQTLPDEIEYMWPAAMSPTKILFFLVRYYVFAHNAIVINFFQFGRPNVGGETCQTPYDMQIWSSLCLYWVCNFILHLRVYAFSGQDRRVLIFLVVWFFGLRAAEGTFVQKFNETMRFMPFPEPIRIGCSAIAGDTQWLTYVFTVIIISLASVTSIMIFIAWRRESLTRAPGGRTNIYQIFIRDGIEYFLCLSLLSIINIIVERTAPPKYRYVMNQVHTHSDAILTGRMLIYLRASAHRELRIMGSHGESQNKMGSTIETPANGMQFALTTLSTGKKTGHSFKATESTLC